MHQLFVLLLLLLCCVAAITAVPFGLIMLGGGSENREDIGSGTEDVLTRGVAALGCIALTGLAAAASLLAFFFFEGDDVVETADEAVLLGLLIDAIVDTAASIAAELVEEDKAANRLACTGKDKPMVDRSVLVFAFLLERGGETALLSCSSLLSLGLYDLVSVSFCVQRKKTKWREKKRTQQQGIGQQLTVGCNCSCRCRGGTC